ncbi:hypothetical protein [Helicobacter sp. UBA3407]|nr:hypothetical protein [Helicobacter sp. UBA3407]
MSHQVLDAAAIGLMQGLLLAVVVSAYHIAKIVFKNIFKKKD